MNKAIIFDMDGTLFQTNTILEPSLVDTFTNLREKNLWSGSTPIEKYREIMGVPLPVVWETLLPDATLEIREYANKIFHGRLIDNIHNGKGALYPNVIKLFTILKGNKLPIFIASNGIPTYLQAIVKHYELDKWIDGVHSIQEIESLDKSELVAWMMKKYEIKSGIVVGDRLSDIKGAKDNGLLSIGCRFDFAVEEELQQADVIIEDLLMVKKVVEEVFCEIEVQL